MKTMFQGGPSSIKYSPDIVGGVATIELLRAGLPNNDGVDAFEVGWVGEEAEVDVATVRIGPIHTRSHMVLKVKRFAKN